MAEAANAAGISQRQGYRWLARFRSGGTAALGDRSSAPGCCKHRIGAERISEFTAFGVDPVWWMVCHLGRLGFLEHLRFVDDWG
jgi:hypothetical protein